MQYRIDHSPSFATLELCLEAGESVVGQPNSMLSMTPGIEIKARIAGQTEDGGLRNGVKNLLSGESLYTAIFTATRDDQVLCLAPEHIGDILALDLGNEGYYLTRGAFLACDSSITIGHQFGGIKGVLAKKGLYLMHTRGPGQVFLSSFGSVIRKRIEEGERFIIDNSYVIAFEDTLHYELVKATDGLKDSLMSGETFVNRYTGPGEVIYQSRGSQRRGGFLSALLEVVT